MSGASRSSCLAVDAIVRAVEADGHVELEFDTQSRCDGCTGLCAFGRPEAPRRVRFRSSSALEPGTVVRVSLPANHVLAAAALLHGVPLIALLAGGCVGALVVPSDVGTLLGALTGLGAALAASRGWRRRAEATTLARATLEPQR